MGWAIKLADYSYVSLDFFCINKTLRFMVLITAESVNWNNNIRGKTLDLRTSC